MSVCLKIPMEAFSLSVGNWIMGKSRRSYQAILQLTKEIKQAAQGNDPTQGTNHYYNPRQDIETWISEWKRNCDHWTSLDIVIVIGRHTFFRTKAEFCGGFKNDYWWRQLK
ncbi:unnamed protein product, partial [Mesorhabditis belari]|uniref:Uncharacterized protein n=1 Tax=Mesorhabditis belari TaxID=2138241 RepID=A0AAF3FBG8_9BILA